MKLDTNFNMFESLAEHPVLQASHFSNRNWFNKLTAKARRAYRFWDEMTTPPPHLPRMVSSRAWRRHSALISCWEEQHRKPDSM